MKFLKLKSKIFKKFPIRRGGRTFFVVGAFNFDLSPPKRVLRERKTLLKKLQIKSHELILLEQIHSDRILFVTRKKLINFLARKSQRGDGLVTNLPNVYLAIRSADCLPILFCHKTAGIIGAVHAGWKGTAKKIIQKVILEARRKFHAPLSDFYFFFGPAAQACHYHVPKARLKSFDRAILSRIVRRSRGKIYLDFVKANYLQLRELGISKRQIEDSGICTIHNQEFPSHRREGAGRKETLLSLIGQTP